ncbi:uncharacterized protein [Heterodontus francisci]|uniref:uncharacterized protein isoform X2 n=1 Tax=Heterodontus francisci TaxID=7792 RepID=UPI00355B7AA6
MTIDYASKGLQTRATQRHVSGSGRVGSHFRVRHSGSGRVRPDRTRSITTSDESEVLEVTQPTLFPGTKWMTPIRL